MTQRDSLEELMVMMRSLVKTEARSSTPGAGATVLSRGEINATDQILFRLRQRVPKVAPDIRAVSDKQEFSARRVELETCISASDKQEFSALRVELETCISASEMFGEVNPRPPGFLNERIQSVKRLMRRSLSWYTRPLRIFHGAVIRTLQQCVATLEKQHEMLGECALRKDLHAAERRLDDVEQGTYQIYQLTQSAIEKSEAQYQVTHDELESLRKDLRELQAEIASNRQQLKEAIRSHRSPEQPSSQRESGDVDFLLAGSKRVKQDQA